MSKKNPNNLIHELEREFISHVMNQSLADLSAVLGFKLDNLTALGDIGDVLKEKGLLYLIHNKDFLDLPVLFHQNDGDKDTFLLEKWGDSFYRAIEFDSEGGYNGLSLCVKMPEHEVKDSKYKTIWDIITDYQDALPEDELPFYNNLID